MTRRRWIADEFSDSQAALMGEHADHLVRVLRVRVGQEFDVAVGDQVRRGRVVAVEPGRVGFELGEVVAATQPVNITLLLSIFKFDRMEWAIEKCTELGVAKIVPVIAQRTDSHLAAAAVKRADRWRKIVLQASEQSRRVAPPEVAAPFKLKEAVEHSGSVTGSFRILLAETEQDVQLRDVLSADAAEIVLAIGPEGGWTDDELKLFHDAGWTSASLGQTILRAETAAIAATAIAVAQLDL
jgi:16S rRNA (uracil1498-N3)-methyltransferase